jgi:hypothetical protein
MRKELPIILNRGSLGDAGAGFGVIYLEEGKPLVGHFPKRDIRVAKQPLSGSTLSGTLSVEVLAEYPDHCVVKVEKEPGDFIKLTIPKPRQP